MQEKRFSDIVKYVREHEICTYEELCSHCDVSLSTVKRDVQTLADQGILLRIRGGAKVPESDLSDISHTSSMRQLHYQPNLDAIAKRASTFVSDNDIIFLGSGVTVAHMVRHLKGHKDLTIITNSLYVTQEAFHYDMGVMMIGGMLNRSTMSYAGIQSVDQLEHLNANIAFMSCNGLALSHGITNVDEVEGDVKKTAIQISGSSILLADGDKFGKVSLYTIAQFDNLKTLITDRQPDDRYVNELKTAHTELIVTGV